MKDSSKKRITDSVRLNAIESGLWFVEPDYGRDPMVWRVGKVGGNGRPIYARPDLRTALDLAIASEGK